MVKRILLLALRSSRTAVNSVWVLDVGGPSREKGHSAAAGSSRSVGHQLQAVGLVKGLPARGYVFQRLVVGLWSSVSLGFDRVVSVTLDRGAR